MQIKMYGGKPVMMLLLQLGANLLFNLFVYISELIII